MKPQHNDYHVFELEQMLSHDHLNRNFNYLNEQERLARVGLIGTGIVRGLTCSVHDNSIYISDGYGITSDGYVISESENKTGLQFFRENVTISDLVTSPVIELFKDKKGNTAHIDTSIWDNRVLLLYRELKEETNSNDCGSVKTGSKISVNVRRLLIDKSYLDQVIGKISWSDAADNPQLKRVPMLRIHLMPSDNVINRKAVKEAFVKSIDNVANDIKNALVEAYDTFRPALQDNYKKSPFNSQISSDSFLNGLFSGGQLPDIPDNSLFQNYYDFFDDLLKAYEEFRQCGLELLHSCCISEKPFPNYLILGDFSEPSSPSSCRHHFRPSTADKDCTEKVQWLFDHIVNMVKFFKVPPSDLEIRLTPSSYGAIPLSDRAIPYYYNEEDIENTKEKEASLYYNWRNDSTENLGYWYKYYEKEKWQNYDLERYNFVRIEGHVGTPYQEDGSEETLKKKIKKQAYKFHLPFEVIALNTEKRNTEICISAQKEIFGALLECSKKNLNDILSEIIRSRKGLKGKAKDAKAAAGKVQTAAKEAQAAAEEAQRAANVQPLDLSLLREAVQKAVKATQIAAEAANNTQLNIVRKGTDTAQKMAEEAQKMAVDDYSQMLEDVKQAAQKVAAAAEQAAAAAEKARAAAEAVVQIVEIEGDLDEGQLLDKYLKENASVKQCYEIVASFACSVKIEGMKIISFLHWLDTAREAYQQCIEKSFTYFLTKHSGIQHKSGVPIGGTFILVYDDKNKVIADFCLPYRVTQPD